MIHLFRPPTKKKLLKQRVQQFRRIAKRLRPHELMRTKVDVWDADLDASDLLSQRSEPRFLGYYGESGLADVLRAYGLEGSLHELGYTSLRFAIDTQISPHRCELFAENPGTRGRSDGAETVRLAHVLAHVEPEFRLTHRTGSMLVIEWLSLEHPRGQFSERRPRLPGQDAPGLMLRNEVGILIQQIVWRLRLDGWMTRPAYFHNSEMYALGLRYLDPIWAGTIASLRHHLRTEHSLGLAQATWAIEWGMVRWSSPTTTKDDERFDWEGKPMIYVRNRKARQEQFNQRYRDTMERAAATTHFDLDRSQFANRWAKAMEAGVGTEPTTE